MIPLLRMEKVNLCRIPVKNLGQNHPPKTVKISVECLVQIGNRKLWQILMVHCIQVCKLVRCLLAAVKQAGE